MEREYHHNTVGTRLSSKDILRMNRTLFKPAIDYCQIDDSKPGIRVYSKEYVDDSQEEAGIDYYYSFHAIQNKWIGTKQFNLSEEVTENITLDQLTEDECKQVRLQFEQQCVAAGMQMADLHTDPTWNALYAPEIFDRVTLSIALTKSYFFSGDYARKTFSAERRLRVRVGETEDTADAYYETTLDSYDFDDKPLSLDEQVKETDWTPEDYAYLDNASDAMLAMTIEDLNDILSIMNRLQLLTQNNPQHGLFQGE
jgi:hypothetical protein